MPSVSFILGGPSKNPVGGLRIIYEYANRLAQRSWTVSVVHPLTLNPDTRGASVAAIKRLVRFHTGLITGSFLPKRWFSIHPRVRMMWVPDLRERHIPDADYIVACPVQTAGFVHSYGKGKGKKYYFIQHFEDWVCPAEIVEKTWFLPMQKIVISRWLQERAARLGQPAVYIPNGLDFSRFRVDIPYRLRPPLSVLILSHYLEFKGTRFAVEALVGLKRKYPAIKATAFGVCEKPPGFPDFIAYHENPSQERIRALYNSSRVFIASSLSEGWGLTACEAMMCGCAVAATDIPGHREFVVNRENAVFCAPGSADAIESAVDWLLQNPEAAESMALRAPASLEKFDWESRVALFEKALRGSDLN